MKNWEIANKLNIHISLIYKWRKEGISINHPLYYKLIKLDPSFKIKKDKKTAKGKIDQRINNSTSRKQLTLLETDTTVPPEERSKNYYIKNSTFPVVKFRKKDSNTN